MMRTAFLTGSAHIPAVPGIARATRCAGGRLLSIAIRVSFPLGNGQAWEAAPWEGRWTPCQVWAARATGNRRGIWV